MADKLPGLHTSIAVTVFCLIAYLKTWMMLKSSNVIPIGHSQFLILNSNFLVVYASLYFK